MEHLNKGTIIIGYQGIGKSSTVEENPGLYIDLESSNFRDDKGNRPGDWYIYYCNIAWDLAHQGFRVFTSSHETVRQRLSYLVSQEENKNGYCLIDIIVAHPSINIKDDWIERLQKRYDENPTRKNKAALGNAKAMYVENQKDLSECCDLSNFIELKIPTINYKLHDLIDELFFGK